MTRAKILLATLHLGGVLAAQPEVHPDELKLKPKIDRAIGRGVEVLIRRQLRDGTWGRYGPYVGGKTGLCVYALLKCGVAADHPAVRRAMLFLDRVDPKETYTVACMMLAYAASGESAHLDRVRELSKRLVDWQRGGDFGYPHPHNGDNGWTRPDLSNTQYAALGFWIAQKQGVKIPTAAWRRLISAVLRYQARDEKVRIERQGEHTVSGGKVEIAGFGYVPGGKPTGSMTAAGASILQICKIGLGGRLAGDRRAVDKAIEKSLDWLGYHFSVTSNPGKKGWLYYYLYGLERVGSLTSVEQLGSHWWYLDGARWLLGQQRKDGGWPKKKAGQWEVQTAFALLFLRRATALTAITGGTAADGKKSDLFAAGGVEDPVQIRGAGQQPLSLWVEGFGAKLRERHGAQGLRILLVEYLDGDRVIGQVAGEPGTPWHVKDTFLYRASALQRGKHNIKVRVKLVAAKARRGETTPVVTVESPPMAVTIRDVFAEWMDGAADKMHRNLIGAAEKTVTASSNSKQAKSASDGNDASHWVCSAGDSAPEVTITLARPVTAQHVVLSQAGARVGDMGLFDRVETVDLYINRDREPVRVTLARDQLAFTEFELPKPRRIQILRIRVVDRVKGRRPGQAGFSEIGLAR